MVTSPLLVKFLRTFEALLVLSKKECLSSLLFIKRNMSFEERTAENLLLKERRNLIDHVIEQRFIKIRGNSIYVKNKLHGLVQDSKFCLATDINALSTDMTRGPTFNLAHSRLLLMLRLIRSLPIQTQNQCKLQPYLLVIHND